MTIQTIPKIRKLIQSKKRYKVAYGGRGSGKSYGVASFLVAAGLSEKTRILCAKETQNSLADSALAIMKRVISDYDLLDWFRPTKQGLYCPASGTEYIFRGLQHPERIKSLEGIKYCWVEEASKVTHEAWEVLIPTIRDEGSEIWVTFNPDSSEDPVYKMFVEDGRDDAEVVKVNYYDNRFFPEPLHHEMQWDKENDFEKYRHIWEGEPRSISDAQVFHGKYRVDTFETPEDATFYFGADWGFSQDPTVLVRAFVDDGVLYVDQEAYGVGVDIDATPALFRMVPGAERWPITADSARPETISYMKQHGFPKMRRAKKGKNSIEDGISFLRSFREIVVHERCKHTADEFKLYSYKRDRLTGEILPVLEDKHNHAIDALRYAMESAMLKNRVPQINAVVKR
jgi:phage terminase large subunit